MAQLLPDTDPVHKVSIIPTAKGALGYTMQMPEEDQYLLGERELKERMAVMLGGRAAELLIVGEASTGAANDLERATELARRMVTEFGMTEALGPVRYLAEAGMGYLGGQARCARTSAPRPPPDRPGDPPPGGRGAGAGDCHLAGEPGQRWTRSRGCCKSAR